MSNLYLHYQKQLKSLQQSMERRAEAIKKSSGTEQVSLDRFSEAHSFICETFPGVDFSSVKIYLASPEVFKKNQFGTCHGLYLPSLRTIFVQRMEERKADARAMLLQKKLDQLVGNTITTEEILVHELCHAASHITGRACRMYSHAEEEFAYCTSAIFYKKKGLSDEEIVDQHFLVFCFNDLLGSMTEMQAACAAIDQESDFLDAADDVKAYRAFLKKHTERLFPVLLERARERASSMIQMYNRYGFCLDGTETQDSESVCLVDFDDADL